MSCCHLNRAILSPKAASQRGLSATAVSQLSTELLNCFKWFFSVFLKSHPQNTWSFALSTFNIPRHVYSWLSPIIFSNSVLEITRLPISEARPLCQDLAIHNSVPKVEAEIMVGNLTLMSNHPVFRSQLQCKWTWCSWTSYLTSLSFQEASLAKRR